MSTPRRSNNPSLIGAALAGIGASLCCVAPLVLVSLGIGGAWIAHLTALEPYRPIFIVIALIFLGLAFRKLYLQAAPCESGQACATPGTRRNQRLIFWLVSIIVLLLIVTPWLTPLVFY